MMSVPSGPVGYTTALLAIMISPLGVGLGLVLAKMVLLTSVTESPSGVVES